jgi:hypothetical protein
MTPIPKFRTTVPRLMITVAACAVVLALFRAQRILQGPSVGEFLFIVVGPVTGAVAHRTLGGRGLLGGMVGGVAVFCGFGALMYIRGYLHPVPNTVDYLGPVLSLSVLGFFGAVVGLVVGAIIWCLIPRDVPGAVGTDEVSLR